MKHGETGMFPPAQLDMHVRREKGEAIRWGVIKNTHPRTSLYMTFFSLLKTEGADKIADFSRN